MGKRAAAEECGRSIVAVADGRARYLPCSECHDEWIEVLELPIIDSRRSRVLVLCSWWGRMMSSFLKFGKKIATDTT